MTIFMMPIVGSAGMGTKSIYSPSVRDELFSTPFTDSFDFKSYVDFHMFTWRNYLEVIQGIIQRVFIFMMYPFISLKFSTKFLFHQIAMIILGFPIYFANIGRNALSVVSKNFRRFFSVHVNSISQVNVIVKRHN